MKPDHAIHTTRFVCLHSAFAALIERGKIRQKQGDARGAARAVLAASRVFSWLLAYESAQSKLRETAAV